MAIAWSNIIDRSCSYSPSPKRLASHAISYYHCPLQLLLLICMLLLLMLMLMLMINNDHETHFRVYLILEYILENHRVLEIDHHGR